jgi:hypothetical protein
MTTDQMQDVLMYDKDLLTPDEAVELLTDMFDEKFEFSENEVRRRLGLREKTREE